MSTSPFWSFLCSKNKGEKLPIKNIPKRQPPPPDDEEPDEIEDGLGGFDAEPFLPRGLVSALAISSADFFIAAMICVDDDLLVAIELTKTFTTCIVDRVFVTLNQQVSKRDNDQPGEV